MPVTHQCNEDKTTVPSVQLYLKDSRVELFIVLSIMVVFTVATVVLLNVYALMVFGVPVHGRSSDNERTMQNTRGGIISDAKEAQTLCVCDLIVHIPHLAFFVDPDGMEDWCESQLDSANIIDDDHDGHGDGDNDDAGEDSVATPTPNPPNHTTSAQTQATGEASEDAVVTATLNSQNKTTSYQPGVTGEASKDAVVATPTPNLQNLTTSAHTEATDEPSEDDSVTTPAPVPPNLTTLAQNETTGNILCNT
ncbi:uncharacterized protein LOC116224666 isoform X1 [Clupea harengus]|uniref:Uncharacterized protein LOC116224666 isoform X1 n=1 Tax=Clupea harengus TaxID=7950 RepID=A0A6P8GP56_CLUHA|nr:uncharacterized protein LOC116224666 isoform X1 [Clupea harengus]